MIKEFIELFELLFTLPIAYFMDFCDYIQRSLERLFLTEERHRSVKEKHITEEADRKNEEEKTATKK